MSARAIGLATVAVAAAIGLATCSVAPTVADQDPGVTGWEMPPRLWSDPVTVGSGRVIAADRICAPFARIEVRVPFPVRVNAGAATGVTVTVDDNLQEHIGCHVTGDTLVIEAARGIRSAKPGLVEIDAGLVRALATYGPSACRVHGLSGDALRVNQYGDGAVFLAGAKGSLTVQSYGSGVVDADNLFSDKAVVDIYGCGDVIVNTTGQLEATVYGAGNVICHGNPAERFLQEHGTGHVSFP